VEFEWLFLLVLVSAFWIRGGNLLLTSAGDIADCTTCPCIPNCSACSGGTPAQLSVTLAGIVAVGGTPCADCGDLNDTFILNATLDSSCIWVYDIDPPICNFTTLAADLGIDIGTNVLRVLLSDPNGPFIFWKFDIGEDPTDCFATIDALDIPFSTQGDVPGFPRPCNGLPSTCTITAL
jgi:hypothetical protein